MKRAGVLLTNLWVLLAVALLALGFLIWFAGPFLGGAFISAVFRLTLILVLVLGFGLALLVSELRRNRAERDLVAANASAAESVAGAHRAARGGGGDDTLLRQRFQEAIASLRRHKGRRFSLYSLPWYVIIGPPGAGKTTLLQNSGLEFPLADQFGRRAIKGVGGTRNCDWWFTDRAVLLDTAGRYVTQDSDEVADRAGWRNFLALLRRYRHRRPIDGVLLALSTPDVLEWSEGERESHIGAIRRRLTELTEAFGTTVPVYVLLTKADLVAGFNECFGGFSTAQRAQVLGVTLPLAQSRAGVDAPILRRALEEVTRGVEGLTFERAAQETDVLRRGLVIGLPGELDVVTGRAAKLVAEVFRPPGVTAILRGLYLTSGTQQGTPIDRLVAEGWRALGLAKPAVSPPAGAGKSYFVERLLKDVVFTEFGLAGPNRRFEATQRRLGRAAVALAATMLLLGALALSVSYHGNLRLVKNMTATAATLASTRPAKWGDAPRSFLPRLSILAQLLENDRDSAQAGVPWRLRWGLYQGRALSEAARDQYLADLNVTVGPMASRLLAARLQTAPDDPAEVYALLRAYLMLDHPEHLEPAEIRAVVDPLWAERYGTDPATAQSLQAHFDALVADPSRVAPEPADASLVALARETLVRASLPVVIYARIRVRYGSDAKGALHLGDRLGLGASIFQRRSGDSLNAPLPALYTRATFEAIAHGGMAKEIAGFLSESWVLGDQAHLASAASPGLTSEVMNLYARDYIAHWRDLIGDLRLQARESLQATGDLLYKLAGIDSPLRGLLTLIDHETDLSNPGSGKAAALLSGLSGRAGAAAAADITKEFASYHQLLAGAPGTAPIDQLQAGLVRIAQALQAPDVAGSAAALGNLTALTATLPGGLRTMFADIGQNVSTEAAGEARGQINGAFDAQVLIDCRELIGGRYPAARGSTEDVALADYASVFGPGGVYDSFFTQNLQPLVDQSRERWRWREGAELNGAGAVNLRAFERAERIREVLFPAGAKSPQFDFTVSLGPFDDAVRAVRFTMDGQTAQYPSGNATLMSMHWPGPPPGDASLTVTFQANETGKIIRQGPWALFHLLDAAHLEQLGPTLFVATWQLGGRPVRLRIETASARNPLADPIWRGMSCGE